MAIAIDVFQQANLAQPLLVLLRVVAHLGDVQPAIFVEGDRHGAGDQRLGRHLVDSKAFGHRERRESLGRLVRRDARQLGLEIFGRGVLQNSIHETIGFVTHGWRKLMRGIRIAHLQLVGRAQ